ncbi:alanyl-tRNA editing protein [Collibacillus ludicampi]|uniref:Alanyl-tRNA editing protein n=1 Tax=Collibacillus ludicampi TaxID=2771369 RepID=A0AAV4LEK8_9BACL|nr:DHHA1 domain-containing protein [Collibacillus ludicampi]GIM46255.1 alanyl-tRNA editing protein [Collibacillus ludicampi]
MTRKLYYEDVYLREFTAHIVEIGTANGTPYVVLDQTAFYPTGGGQPCDHGSIHGVRVVDVEKVGERIVHHLAEPLSLESSDPRVYGQIDWDRRFDHMQQHTGQHILSAAFEQLFHGETVGFHLGRETVTVDITLPALDQEIVQQVESLANRIVFENRIIQARFVEPEELKQLPLRKPPQVRENIRIVTITDFDHNPCGGTHPERTGEGGPIKILSWERYKGHVRVEFVCGWRALKEMSEKQQILRQLILQLTCGEHELPANVIRLLDERKDKEKALQEACSKLLDFEANEWVKQSVPRHGIHLVTRTFAERSMQEMQRLAQQITARDPLAVVLFVSGGTKTQLVFARGSDVRVEMNALLKETLPLIAGKGGGTPAIAQGGGVTSQSPDEVLAHAVNLLEQKLEQIVKGK